MSALNRGDKLACAALFALATLLITLFLLSACIPGAPHGVPTRAQIEAGEDRFCEGVAKARLLERDLGLLPDSGAAGAVSVSVLGDAATDAPASAGSN